MISKTRISRNINTKRQTLCAEYCSCGVSSSCVFPWWNSHTSFSKSARVVVVIGMSEVCPLFVGSLPRLTSRSSFDARCNHLFALFSRKMNVITFVFLFHSPILKIYIKLGCQLSTLTSFCVLIEVFAFILVGEIANIKVIITRSN